MTWIKTVPLAEASEELKQAMEAQRELYPIEYATPVHPTPDGPSGIVASHTLIPRALHHAFATFGALMSPELPAEARAARDDRHPRLGAEPLPLLNRVPRRVSASRNVGREAGAGHPERLRTCPV